MKQKKYFTIILETCSNVLDVIVSRVGRDGNLITSSRLDDAVVGLLLLCSSVLPSLNQKTVD